MLSSSGVHLRCACELCMGAVHAAALAGLQHAAKYPEILAHHPPRGPTAQPTASKDCCAGIPGSCTKATETICTGLALAFSVALWASCIFTHKR